MSLLNFLINRSFHRYSLTATINFCGMGQAKCEICHKLLANRRSVRRHRKEVHKIYPQTNSFECTECGFTTRSLYELTGHMTVQHEATSPRYCIYCQKCFPRDADYLEHMNTFHGLPAWSVDVNNLQDSGIIPSERAFGDTLKVYEITVGSRDVDLLHVMQLKRREIENIININVQQHSQKVQFNSVIDLVKPTKTDDDLSSSQPDRISIHVASKMERVDFGGLADKTFHAMVEQMLLALNNFASHGSGWTLNQIVNIEIRLAKAKPIRASSYLALPGKLARTCSLLNIRNREDENCFLYCYTAAYHFKFAPRLLPPGAPARRITSPVTYGPGNPLAKQADGVFDMPMGFHQMTRFEELNNVCVNVFR